MSQTFPISKQLAALLDRLSVHVAVRVCLCETCVDNRDARLVHYLVRLEAVTDYVRSSLSGIANKKISWPYFPLDPSIVSDAVFQFERALHAQWLPILEEARAKYNYERIHTRKVTYSHKLISHRACARLMVTAMEHAVRADWYILCTMWSLFPKQDQLIGWVKAGSQSILTLPHWDCVLEETEGRLLFQHPLLPHPRHFLYRTVTQKRSWSAVLTESNLECADSYLATFLRIITNTHNPSVA